MFDHGPQHRAVVWCTSRKGNKLADWRLFSCMRQPVCDLREAIEVPVYTGTPLQMRILECNGRVPPTNMDVDRNLDLKH